MWTPAPHGGRELGPHLPAEAARYRQPQALPVLGKCSRPRSGATAGCFKIATAHLHQGPHYPFVSKEAFCGRALIDS